MAPPRRLRGNQAFSPEIEQTQQSASDDDDELLLSNERTPQALKISNSEISESSSDTSMEFNDVTSATRSGGVSPDLDIVQPSQKKGKNPKKPRATNTYGVFFILLICNQCL